MYAVYWRCRANVMDIRKFKDTNEFGEWLRRQAELDGPTTIIGIYDSEMSFEKAERDYENFCDYLKKKMK